MSEDLVNRLRACAEYDVRSIAADHLKGIIPMERKDFENWAGLMDEAAAAIELLQKQAKLLTAENLTLKAGIGQAIAMAKETDE